MDVRSRTALLASAASNWLAFAATMAVGFFLAPHLIHTLGKPRYDAWCVVESVLAYFTLLDLGVAACLMRAVARRLPGDDPDVVNRTASASLAVYLIAAAVVVVVGTPLLWATSGRLAGKLDAPDELLPFALLMMLTVAALLPLGLFVTVLGGLSRYPAMSGVRVLFLTLRTGGVVLAAPHGLVTLGAVTLVSQLAEHAALAWLCFRAMPDLKLRPFGVGLGELRSVAASSRDAFLAMLAGRITVQTGAILIGLFLPAGQVTFYVTAGRLVDYAKTLLRTVTATMTPGAGALEARGDWDGLRAMFLGATRWLLYLALPVQVGLLLFGRPFLARWVGPEFVGGSYATLVILSMTLTLGVAASAAARMLYGLGRLRVLARLSLAEAGLNVVLMVLLIGRGVEGVAVAVAAPNVLFCVVLLGYFLRQIELSWRAYLSAWLAPALATAPPTLLWLALGEPAAAWPAILAFGLAGVVPYAASVALWEAVIRPRLARRAADPIPAPTGREPGRLFVGSFGRAASRTRGI